MFVNFHMFLFLVAGFALIGFGMIQVRGLPNGLAAGFILAAGIIAVIVAFTANRS